MTKKLLGMGGQNLPMGAPFEVDPDQVPTPVMKLSQTPEGIAVNNSADDIRPTVNALSRVVGAINEMVGLIKNVDGEFEEIGAWLEKAEVMNLNESQSRFLDELKKYYEQLASPKKLIVLPKNVEEAFVDSTPVLFDGESGSNFSGEKYFEVLVDRVERLSELSQLFVDVIEDYCREEKENELSVFLVEFIEVLKGMLVSLEAKQPFLEAGANLKEVADGSVVAILRGSIKTRTGIKERETTLLGHAVQLKRANGAILVRVGELKNRLEKVEENLGIERYKNFQQQLSLILRDLAKNDRIEGLTGLLMKARAFVSLQKQLDQVVADLSLGDAQVKVSEISAGFKKENQAYQEQVLALLKGETFYVNAEAQLNGVMEQYPSEFNRLWEEMIKGGDKSEIIERLFGGDGVNPNLISTFVAVFDVWAAMFDMGRQKQQQLNGGGFPQLASPAPSSISNVVLPGGVRQIEPVDSQTPTDSSPAYVGEQAKTDKYDVVK